MDSRPIMQMEFKGQANRSDLKETRKPNPEMSEIVNLSMLKRCRIKS